MIIVTELILGTDVEYDIVEDFVRDWITDSEIEELITNDFGYCELPLDAGTIGYGEIIHTCASDFDWRRITENFIEVFIEEIEDALVDNDEYYFYEYRIKVRRAD